MTEPNDAAALPKPQGKEPEGKWDSTQLERFVKGEITLAELEGDDGESQSKMVHIGHRLLTSGKLDDARLIFEGLVALNPYEPYFLLAAGAVAQRQERFDDADHWYSRSVERDDKNAVTRANRGEVRLMLGQLTTAADDLMEAVRLDPQGKEPTTQRARGLLLEIKRQLDDARAAPKPAKA